MKKLIAVAALVFAGTNMVHADEDLWTGVLLASNSSPDAFSVIDRGEERVPENMIQDTLSQTLDAVSEELTWELEYRLTTGSTEL